MQLGINYKQHNKIHNIQLSNKEVKSDLALIVSNSDDNDCLIKLPTRGKSSNFLFSKYDNLLSGCPNIKLGLNDIMFSNN